MDRCCSISTVSSARIRHRPAEDVDEPRRLHLGRADLHAVLVNRRARAAHLPRQRHERTSENDHLLQRLTLQHRLTRLEKNLRRAVGVDDALVLGENEDRMRQRAEQHVVLDVAAARCQHGPRLSDVRAHATISARVGSPAWA